MASDIEIGEILAVLAATYPRFKLTGETISAYIQFLHDIPAAALRAAALHCATSYDFFPSVHELRSAVSDNWRKAQSIPSAYEAWDEVRKAKPEYSRLVIENGQNIIEHFSHAWTHPLVERVARLLGWPDTFPGDNPGVDRAHFFKAYEQTLAGALEETVRLPEVTAYIEGARSGMMRLGEGKNGR